MLSCREVGDKASDYLEGNLSWWRRAEVWLHIVMCRHCRRYLVQLRLMTRALRLMRKRDPAEHECQDDIVRMLIRRRRSQ